MSCHRCGAKGRLIEGLCPKCDVEFAAQMNNPDMWQITDHGDGRVTATRNSAVATVMRLADGSASFACNDRGSSEACPVSIVLRMFAIGGYQWADRAG